VPRPRAVRAEGRHEFPRLDFQGQCQLFDRFKRGGPMGTFDKRYCGAMKVGAKSQFFLR
jgi:hypothetical protein